MWDYTETIPEEYLRQLSSVEILEDGEVQSEQLLFNIVLEPEQIKEFSIVYIYEPIEKKVQCEQKQIVDYLPKNAKIVESDLPLDTLVSKTCTVTIYHPASLPFTNVTIPLDEINPELVTSITHLQTGETIRLQNNTLHLA